MERELMIRYLLGELSETEQRRLEESFFTDPVFLREFQATRDDLVDAFVRGELNTREKTRFERCLRSSPTLVEKVDFARTLLRALDARRPARLGSLIKNSKPKTATRHFAGLKSAFRSVLAIHLHTWGLVAACLLFTAGVLLFATQSRKALIKSPDANQVVLASPPAERQSVPNIAPGSEDPPTTSRLPVARNQHAVDGHFISFNAGPPAGRPAKVAASIASFLLTSGTSRGVDDQFELAIQAQTVKVRLQLEVEEDDSPHYRILLRGREGQKIWAKEHVSAVKQRGGRVVICELPTRLLENGNYILSLHSRRVDDAADSDYHIKVTRPYLPK